MRRAGAGVGRATAILGTFIRRARGDPVLFEPGIAAVRLQYAGVRFLPAVVTVPLVLPLFAFSIWFYGHQQHAPVFDFALTEMRVRDVGTTQTPLVGLPGRLGSAREPGSHPGPLCFYLLAPVYRVLGSSWWALRVSTAFFHAAAIAVALALARRVGGVAAVLGTGVLFALLELAFGYIVLTIPWIPYLPLSWFIVFLIATWSLITGDTQML